MAIGNVGTYATVEGTPVDFGKMISSNIDKYQEGQALQEKLKQERAAAKAKSISEEMSRLKDIKTYTSSGKHEYDDPVLSTLSQFKDGLYNLQQGVSTGEVSSLYANQYAEKANQAIEIMNNGAKYIQEKSKWLQDNRDKLNTEFLDPDALGNFLKNTKSQVQPNGEVMFTYEGKDGKVSSSNINEIVDKVYDIPKTVDLAGSLAKFQASHKQDEIARIQGGMIVTPTEQNQHLKDSIADQAGAWISDRDTKATLWSQYEASLPEGAKKVGPKKDNFSEDQTKKLYDYANNIISDSYNKELKMTSLPKAGGDGSGSGKKGKTPPNMGFSGAFNLRPSTLPLINGGTEKVEKGTVITGYSAQNTLYGKDDTGTKQAVTLLRNNKTGELYASTASSASETEGAKTNGATYSKTTKGENKLYAGSDHNSDDFFRLAQSYIGARYTDKKGERHTIENASIGELSKWMDAVDKSQGLNKFKPAKTGTTNTEKVTSAARFNKPK